MYMYLCMDYLSALCLSLSLCDAGGDHLIPAVCCRPMPRSGAAHYLHELQVLCTRGKEVYSVVIATRDKT